jgi:hypothetical protein
VTRVAFGSVLCLLLLCLLLLLSLLLFVCCCLSAVVCLLLFVCCCLSAVALSAVALSAVALSAVALPEEESYFCLLAVARLSFFTTTCRLPRVARPMRSPLRGKYHPNPIVLYWDVRLGGRMRSRRGILGHDGDVSMSRSFTLYALPSLRI